MQFTGFDHFGQLPTNAQNRLINRAAVAFNLCLARPPHKAHAATLAFQMGPSPHQTRALIVQRRQFNLQHTFTRAGAVGKNL